MAAPGEEGSFYSGGGSGGGGIVPPPPLIPPSLTSFLGSTSVAGSGAAAGASSAGGSSVWSIAAAAASAPLTERGDGTPTALLLGSARDVPAPMSMLWYQPQMKHPEGTRPETVPGPRAAHSCNLIGNKMFVFGGWTGKCGLNDVHVLNVDTLEWSTVSTYSGTAPSTRNNHATFVYGTKLFIHGGHDGMHWLDDMHVLETAELGASSSSAAALSGTGSPAAGGGMELRWTQPVVAGTLPSARACHTTTLLGRKVYLFGGFDGAKCFNSLDVLDLDSLTWFSPHVSGTVPQARNAQTVTVVGTRLLLFGGHSGNKHLHDLHVLDTETLTWSQPEMKGKIPPGLRGHTANLIGNKIFLFGGYDGRFRSRELYILDTETMTWEHPPVNESTPAGRQRHTACLVGGRKLFVLGGFDGSRWLNDVHVLDVGKLEESAITTASVTSLLDDFGSMVNNAASFPDVTFIVDGEPVVAHRAVLAARSPHFRAMFSSGMRESREKEIEYGEWSTAAFIGMLHFLYTGRVPNLTHALAAELLGLADHCALDSLKALCETALLHSMDASNVCTNLLVAHRYMALPLKRGCVDFILRHGDAVSLDPLAVEPQVLLEITRELLSRTPK